MEREEERCVFDQVMAIPLLSGTNFFVLVALSIRPVPFGAKSLVESSDSPKRSWFQNLFNFKPAPYTLWSYESVAMTSRVLQQRLNQLGVRVAADKFQDQIVLRCKLATSLGKQRTVQSTYSRRLTTTYLYYRRRQQSRLFQG
jgi:hypothetical protein